MARNKSTPPAESAHPRELRFRALRDSPSDRIKAGDVLLWQADRPMLDRVVVESRTTIHSGRLDRLTVEGFLEPVGLTFADARAAMIDALLADQRAAVGRP